MDDIRPFSNSFIVTVPGGEGRAGSNMCVRIRRVTAYLGSLTKGDSKTSCSLYMAAAFKSKGSSLAALSRV